MSILIKGMEMPKNGGMKKIIIGRAPNGIEPIAIVTGDITEFYKIFEVPTPHGRLIDADELFCKIDGIKGWDYGDESDMAISAAEALSAIDDSPTIIEAEVSK